ERRIPVYDPIQNVWLPWPIRTGECLLVLRVAAIGGRAGGGEHFVPCRGSTELCTATPGPPRGPAISPHQARTTRRAHPAGLATGPDVRGPPHLVAARARKHRLCDHRHSDGLSAPQAPDDRHPARVRLMAAFSCVGGRRRDDAMG